MKHYFLGTAAHFSTRETFAHTFAMGRERDRDALQRYLTQKYKGETILTKNGRSALALALKAYFQPGDAVIVNGFTCYAVYEAVKAARLVPVWADVSCGNLNFDITTLKNALKAGSGARVKGIIIQNSLGNPVDIAGIEKFAKQHDLTIIEDLAHCAGVHYADGREVGTVGAAAALSFGKDKSIDTISGGAVVLRKPNRNEVAAPSKLPRISDTMRARFYPFFGAMTRMLSYVHLGGAFMRCLVKIHWVEKSADSALDLTRKIAKFEAKLALMQLKSLNKSGERPLREFCLVKNRIELMNKLRKNGYYFDGFWYEKPVSPERYYKKVHFPENECPVATDLTSKIINIPKHYSKKDLALARKIIAEYIEEDR